MLSSMTRDSRFSKSEKLLEFAESVIPLGSQTFSKSRTQYPVGVSPFFAHKGLGSYLWDVDGNKYIDLVASLAAVTLGYGDPEISKAVKKQLKSGVSLSLSSKLESVVAEKIIEMVPSAELVRFAKNGSDVTSAAVRISRHFTGRDFIISVGYHGWHDWYIGSTTRSMGVPKAVQELTLSARFNDLSHIENLFNSVNGNVAAVIIEPMSSTDPAPGYLESLRRFCTSQNVLLIFDEVITGFRFSKGGAQELFKVTPDLSCFGKGMANGFPISALAGKKEIMKGFKDVFFSGTFGGELLSLAAANVVLDKILKGEVISELYRIGENLQLGLMQEISKKRYDFVSISGNPTWSFINWSLESDDKQNKVKTYFLQEMFKRNVLVLNSNNITTTLKRRDIEKVLGVYAEVFSLISNALNSNNLDSMLECQPIVPLFKIR
jgi:glutamate-1-semialdehyde 2,1-aminomutase